MSARPTGCRTGSGRQTPSARHWGLVKVWRVRAGHRQGRQARVKAGHRSARDCQGDVVCISFRRASATDLARLFLQTGADIRRQPFAPHTTGCSTWTKQALLGSIITPTWLCTALTFASRVSPILPGLTPPAGSVAPRRERGGHSGGVAPESQPPTVEDRGTPKYSHLSGDSGACTAPMDPIDAEGRCRKGVLACSYPCLRLSSRSACYRGS